jgi:AcrR family transcriptional regulator
MTIQGPLDPRKRPRQRRAQETLDAILQATAQVLEADGYNKLSTNLVAKVAGVSIGSLYQYFPNKDALLLELFQRHTDEMLTLLGREVLSMATEPIPDAVRRFIRLNIHEHAEHPRLHLALVQHMLNIGPEHVQLIQDRALAAVKAYLALHRDEILPQNLDVAAFVLVTTVQGVIHAAVLERPDYLDEEALEQELCDIVLRYLLPPDAATAPGPGR